MVVTEHVPRRVQRRDRRWRLRGFPLVIALVCFVGVGILVYPTAAAWTQQYFQSQIIRDISDDLEHVGAADLREDLAEARAYNAGLVGGAELAANERKPLADGSSAAPSRYEDLLNADGSGLMGRLQIPSIDADLAISHGTSDEVLEEGVGHLEGTALPVGGAGTHAVLTAHRGLATAELFTRLDEVVIGDTFTISVFGEVLTYQVRDTQVVAPEDTELLNAVVGEDLVTLVTCTPLGINSHRILVTGERILPTPAERVEAASRGPEVPRFPWWTLVLGGAFVILCGYVWWAGRPPRRRDRAGLLSPPAPAPRDFAASLATSSRPSRLRRRGRRGAGEVGAEAGVSIRSSTESA